MYIGADGTVHQGGQPWGLQKLIGLFWAFINFIVVFFRTLFNFDTGGRTTTNPNDNRGFGGPGGPGPRRRIGTIRTLPECNIPGGG